MTAPFWVIDHPYTAPDSNFFASGLRDQDFHHVFATWDEFFSEMGDLDEDYNHLYRWDFYPADEDEEHAESELHFCFILQRKGTFLWAKIQNPQPEDEEKIRAYLTEKWEYVRKLWAPLSWVSP